MTITYETLYYCIEDIRNRKYFDLAMSVYFFEINSILQSAQADGQTVKSVEYVNQLDREKNPDGNLIFFRIVCEKDLGLTMPKLPELETFERERAEPLLT